MTKTRKRAPRWQAAFLRALSRYGNVGLAAEAAGIDKTVCYTRRRGDAKFAAVWARAKERAAARLAAAGMKPLRRLPPGIAPGGGDRSQARGDADSMEDGLIPFAGYGFMPPRLQRPRRGGWSAAKEDVFLQRLADTCNVREASRAIGMAPISLYRRRAHDPRFAHRWKGALENGMLALQAKLIDATCAVLEGRRTDADVFVPGDAPVDNLWSAILLVSEHRKQQAGTKRRGWTPKPLPPIEEVRADILRKVAALDHAAKRREGQQGGGSQDVSPPDAGAQSCCTCQL